MSETADGLCAVVIVAAGSGTRLGKGIPKARVLLGDSPILEYTMKGVLKARVAQQIIVVIPENDAVMAKICADVMADSDQQIAYSVVQGGAERADSVRAALKFLDPRVTTVLIHDAARALTPKGVFDRVVNALQAGAKAVIPALAVVDTVKKVVPAELPTTGAGVEKVSGTPARKKLRAVQTPQGFELNTLRRAHEYAATLSDNAAGKITDDSMLVEALGEDVYVVQGSTHSLKITTPTDLLLAEAMLTGPLRPRWVEG